MRLRRDLTLPAGFEEGAGGTKARNMGGPQKLGTALGSQPTRKQELSLITTRN